MHMSYLFLPLNNLSQFDYLCFILKKKCITGYGGMVCYTKNNEKPKDYLQNLSKCPAQPEFSRDDFLTDTQGVPGSPLDSL